MQSIEAVIAALTDFAPLSLQESWDNSGVQVGDVHRPCTGVMLCVDVTPVVIGEALSRGCNLIVAHHPLLFRGLKQICPGDNLVQQTVFEAISLGLTVFSLHTAIDSATEGISHRMATMLGASVEKVLIPGSVPDTGLGVVAKLFLELSCTQFVNLVKTSFGTPMVRCSCGTGRNVRRVGLCGGSGGEFIPAAIAAGCDAYLSSDIRYHDFVDYGSRIFLVDIGHFESEACVKQIFYDVISKKFPNFAVYKSELERNSINYL